MLKRTWKFATSTRTVTATIAHDEQLITEMKKFVSSPLASKYERAAASAAIAERRRYCLDVARELYFLGVRDQLYQRNASGDYPALAQATKQPLLERGPIGQRYTLGDTLAYWKLAQEIDAFMNDYGSGHLRPACADLKNVSQLHHPAEAAE